jgi:transcriptional regulator with XRE-family HTH domain
MAGFNNSPNSRLFKSTYFGLKCAEMRKKPGVNQSVVAEKMGYTQEYLSKLENGQKPLTVQVLKKYLAAFYEIGKEASNHSAKSLGVFPLDDQLEFTRDLFDQADKIEIHLSDVSVAHRDNITRLAAILAVDDFFPIMREAQQTARTR